MKKILLILLCIAGVKFATAQQNLLSLDEHNKYIYYEVTEIPGFGSDSLQEKTMKFLKTILPKLSVISENPGKTEAQGKILIYGSTTLFHHITGAVAYNLHIEFKDQKYRFWFTGFVCTPYQRDRYGNFVPKEGIDVPMESTGAKFEKADAKSYLDQTGTFCREFDEKLKKFLLTIHTPKKEETSRKVVTDKW